MNSIICTPHTDGNIGLANIMQWHILSQAIIIVAAVNSGITTHPHTHTHTHTHTPHTHTHTLWVGHLITHVLLQEGPQIDGGVTSCGETYNREYVSVAKTTPPTHQQPKSLQRQPLQ